MQFSVAVMLSMTLAVHALPTSKRSPQLLDLSPVVSPDIDLGGDNQCTGIGISVCDPITVDREMDGEGTEESTKATDDTKVKTTEIVEEAAEGQSGTKLEDKKKTKEYGTPLINLSPDISPDLSLGGDNGCLGLGISACNPINVKSPKGGD